MPRQKKVKSITLYPEVLERRNISLLDLIVYGVVKDNPKISLSGISDFINVVPIKHIAICIKGLRTKNLLSSLGGDKSIVVMGEEGT